jgi:hypothetical protein
LRNGADKRCNEHGRFSRKVSMGHRLVPMRFRRTDPLINHCAAARPGRVPRHITDGSAHGWGLGFACRLG